MTEVTPLRIAHIGAGAFSNGYIFPQLAAHSVRLVGICDLIEEKARAAAARYGFEHVHTDFRQLLEAEEPDAVVCIGGPKVHYEVGRELLERGFPLYVQKSPAPSSAATQELADLAAKARVICHVGFNIRSSEALLRAKEIMARDEFGPVTLVIVRYGLVSGATLRDAVMDQHCHAFDLLRQLGGEVRELAVRRGEVAGDRGYVAAVKFESGAVGSVNFTSGQIPGQEFLYFEVTGTDGHFVTCHDFDLTYRSATAPDEAYRIGNFAGRLRDLTWLGYVGDLANFLDAVRGVAEDRAPIGDTVPTMKLCEEAYRQLREQGAEE